MLYIALFAFSYFLTWKPVKDVRTDGQTNRQTDEENQCYCGLLWLPHCSSLIIALHGMVSLSSTYIS